MKDRPGFSSFVPMPRQRLPFPSTVAASRNDPCVAFERAAGYARFWGSQLIDIGYAGHVNIESGFGRWPGGADLLPPLRKETAALRVAVR